jgi:ketosteroid isomerase-like protein
MEAELASRIKESEKEDEDLQTAITDAKTAAEFGVRKSQSEFYEAFSNGDIEAMSNVWSDTSQIRCVHPGMASVEGRKAVMESWKRYFSVPVPPSASSSSFFTIEPERVQIEICGLIAICSCVERTQGGGQLEALNIYKREDGRWKMTLHQAGPVMRFA